MMLIYWRQSLLVLAAATSVARCLKLPTLAELQTLLPSAREPEPLVVDTVLQLDVKPTPGRLTLFRERNGWCPYSERVFLAFEHKKLSYDTFLIDNMGRRPDWYYGSTPQVRWEDGSQQGESMDIVRSLDERYPSTPSINGPKELKDEIDLLERSFKSIFPRNTRPSSRAAFLFSSSGGLLFKSEFEKTLRRTEELLGKHSSGAFFAGEDFTIADVAWVPFLERYSEQLPWLHRWFESMEELPVYSSRVAGDSESWRKVLDMQGYGNAGVVPNLIKNEDNFNNPQNYFYSDRELDVFRSYANDRAHIADHPGLEAAARVLRNKESLEKDMLRIHKGLSADDADNACRAVISALLLDNRANVDFNLEISLEELLNSPLTKTGANYLAERICVPRDMGKLPAKAIYKLSLTCR